MNARYEVRRSGRLSADEKNRWSTLLRDRDFGAIATDWCDALADSKPSGFELHYFQVFEGEAPKALGILHVLRRVDLSRYMGAVVRGLFAGVGALGWKPLSVDLAFLEIPLANLSGILLAPGAERDSLEIGGAIVAQVRQDFRYDIFCLKASAQAPGEAAYQGLGLLRTEFIANMSLPLVGHSGFEAYVTSLKPRMRTQIRTFSRIFSAAGGTIEIREAPSGEEFEAMAALYQQTCAEHARLGEIEVPIPHGREFFQAIFQGLPAERRRVFLARLKGKTIGFALTVNSGKSLYFTHCGLDYAQTLPSKAYFNLYHSLIDFSIRQGCEALELGAQAYEVKRKFGGRPHPTCYHFEVTRPVLGAVAKLVARTFSSQEGARLPDPIA